MITVLKRDGRSKDFDKERIIIACDKAYQSIGQNITEEEKEEIVNFIESKLENYTRFITVEEIQNLVVEHLSEMNMEVAVAYQLYREERSMERERRLPIVNKIHELGKESDTDNANKLD